LLKEAIELGADFVDIELAKGRAIIKEIQSFPKNTGEKQKLLFLTIT